MSFLGTLYGSEVHLNENCVKISTAFTRKQTRKFKNTRWVKKYLKKYSYEITKPAIVQFHDKIIMHPDVYKAIKEKYNEQENGRKIQGYDRQREFNVPTIGMGRRSIFAQPY